MQKQKQEIFNSE